MLTGEPLFPGDSDIDQLYHIVKVFGEYRVFSTAFFYQDIQNFKCLNLQSVCSVFFFDNRY